MVLDYISRLTSPLSIPLALFGGIFGLPIKFAEGLAKDRFSFDFLSSEKEWHKPEAYSGTKIILREKEVPYNIFNAPKPVYLVYTPLAETVALPAYCMGRCIRTLNERLTKPIPK